MHVSEGSRANVVIWVVAALVAGFALLRLAGCDHGGGGGSGVRIERSGGAGRPTEAPARRGAAAIYVHVAGAVRRPGLIRMASGSRVAAAVDRAGGATRRADLAGVNLAAQLEDGQQVLVPVRGAAGVGAPGGAAGSAAEGGTAGGAGAAGVAGTGGAGTAAPGTAGVPKLSLGAATVEQLDAVDGIGPTLAHRIVEYRTAHGGFRSLGELRDVDGIGDKRFETLRKALQP